MDRGLSLLPSHLPPLMRSGLVFKIIDCPANREAIPFAAPPRSNPDIFEPQYGFSSVWLAYLTVIDHQAVAVFRSE
jgi:hypothetical protein